MLYIYINCAIILLLVFMAVQDFRYRAISWYAFPLLAIGMVLSNRSFEALEFGLNVLLIAMNFGLLTLLLSLKYKKPVNPFSLHIGLGDLLMLICTALYFPVVNFFVFYLLSLILIILGAGILQLFLKNRPYTIPLAGLHSLMLLCLLLSISVTGTAYNSLPWFEKYLP